jgi:hypothetical protein
MSMRSFDEEPAAAHKVIDRAVEQKSPAPIADGNTKTPRGILQLQRSVGNQGVAQLLRGDEDRQSIENAVHSGGQPLDANTRVQMEQAMGADFSGVRVHSGNDAATSAKQLGAHAYTVGEDVVFGAGQYDPATPSGQRTLAHELTHVVQQRSGPVDGTATGGGVKVSDPADPFERHAEAVADQVMASQAASVAAPAPASSAGSVQRDAGEDEEVQTLAVQRHADEDVQMLAVQRDAGEDEEVQQLAVQRLDPGEEQEVQELAIQREEDEEMVQELAIQRETPEEEEQPAED